MSASSMSVPSSYFGPEAAYRQERVRASFAGHQPRAARRDARRSRFGRRRTQTG